MISILKRILGRKNYPLNKIKISSKNLINNYKFLSNYTRNTLVAPVLKSNGYGHGLIQIGLILDKLNCPFFCVDSLYEAHQLIKANIKTPILIMGYLDPENLKVKKLPFSYAVFDLNFARIVNQYQKDASLHLFVDTGMNREGVKLEELESFVEEIKQLKNIKLEGIMSHLASSNKNDPQAKLQLKRFEMAIKICQKLGLDLKWKHLAASGGLWNGYTRGTNLVRVGRALYGIEPNDTKNKLKPILTLKTKLIQIKTIAKDKLVGYEGTFKTKKETKIGILPIGYNDGVDRRLSSKGRVKIAKLFCPIIGRISMNITTIDISEVKNPFIGQEVIVFSNNPKDPNSISSSSKLCQTIPHDLLVGLESSIRREIV